MSNILDGLFGGSFQSYLESLSKSSLGGIDGGLDDVVNSILFRDLRPQIVWWLLRHGTHTPKCGFHEKGDLVRWKDCAVNGGKLIRMPTVRVDYLQVIVDGRIEVKGVELVEWLSTKLNKDAKTFFVALARQRSK